ncbi:hypothetical protein ACFLYQ_04890 [Chloroflexota bacterium]
MGSKVYVLLSVSEEKIDLVIENLRKVDGISSVDIIDGEPNIIAVFEASERKKLVQPIMQVINSVENMIQDLRLLPVLKSSSKVYHILDTG